MVRDASFHIRLVAHDLVSTDAPISIDALLALRFGGMVIAMER
jgi:hypothetical protein